MKTKSLWVVGVFSLLGGVAVTLAALPLRADDLWSEKKDAKAIVVPQLPNFAALAAQVSPAVVGIQVEVKPRGPERRPGRSGRPQQMDPFEFFFGPRGESEPGPQEFGRGLGSGLVIRKDGLILANYHVVENADSIEVTIERPDGTQDALQAKVLGSSADYDVALLKTDTDANATVAYLGDSSTVKIGDWVMAIGNPFGLSHSVSAGIISAKERRDIMPSGRAGLYDFLQTDASINPGNSGGPLVNMSGEVIGINTAINAQGSGIGFAIPINMLKEMLPQLKNDGKFARSWIGVKIQQMTPALAQSYGLEKPYGALVAEVVPKGPGAEAGLKAGDVILEFGGRKIVNSSDLPLAASMAGVGKRIDVKIFRDGKEKAIAIKLGRFPGEEQVAETGSSEDSKEGMATDLGMRVSDLTPQVKERLELTVDRGAVIVALEPNSNAARAGARPGDTVVEVNGVAISSARDFATQVKNSKSVLRLKLMRRDGTLFIAVKK